MRIVVGGLGRKVGKTALVCRMIRVAPEMNWTAVKVSHHAPENGAAYELVEAPEAGDTKRYLEAGARRAYWMKGDLRAGLAELRRVLEEAENWIVESTTAQRELEHDWAVLVVDEAETGDEKLRRLVCGRVEED